MNADIDKLIHYFNIESNPETLNAEDAYHYASELVVLLDDTDEYGNPTELPYSEREKILIALTNKRQRIFDPLAIIVITRALGSESPEIQATAISCLLNLRNEARKSLTKTIEKLTSHSNILVRQTAIDYLALTKKS